MAAKLIKISFLGILFLLAARGCMYDLDVSGVVHIDDNVNERFNQSMLWNAENNPRIIATYGYDYRVLFGGDSHVGGTDNMQTLIDVSHESFALAMVIAGDATTGREDDYLVLSETLNKATFVQTCLVPGNHDLYFDGWNSFHSLFGSSAYTMDIISAGGTDLYIFLDSGGGTLGSLQLAWLKELLQSERDNYRYCIVTTHLNFFRNRMTGSTNPLNEELLVLLDLFEKHNVNLLISGHDHDRYIEQFGHTTYITLDAMIDGIPQASYLELTVNEEGLNYEFIRF